MILNRNSAIVYLLLASVVISFGGLIMRNIHFADPWQIAFYRSLAFTFSILIVLVIQYRSNIKSSIMKVGYPGIIGGAFLMATNLFFIQAIANTSVANALFTLSSIPFITTFFAFLFLKETLSLRTIIIMLFALFGIFIMINDGLVSGGFYGNIMSVLTALCFSGFAILVRKYRNIDMVPTLLISGFMIIVVSFFLNNGSLSIPFRDMMLCFLWGGILSGFVNSIFIFATRYLFASEVTFFMLLEFSLGPFWVWLFMNETISRQTMLGGLIVMICVALYSCIEIYISRVKIKRGRIPPT